MKLVKLSNFLILAAMLFWSGYLIRQVTDQGAQRTAENTAYQHGFQKGFAYQGTAVKYSQAPQGHYIIRYVDKGNFGYALVEREPDTMYQEVLLVKDLPDSMLSAGYKFSIP
jgi:hypothetical protein